jgi:multicomponent Na+:H+ antiporter subunit D
VTAAWAIAPLVVAVATAVATLLVRSRPRLRDVTSLLGGASLVVAAVGSLVASRERILVYAVGGDLFDDGVPFGILFHVDAFSGFMLALGAGVLFAALVAATARRARDGTWFHPFWHLMSAGVMGAFATGDLFNLFVWFEVLLMASYVLVSRSADADASRAGFYYVAVNLVGSATMLVAIGGIYATTGTLNMAGVAARAQAGGADPALYGLGALLFAAFVLKAGAFPLHSWAIEVYPASDPAVAAALAGVVKKVGVYAVLRVFGTVMSPLGGFFAAATLAVAATSVLYGGWAAVGSDDLEEMLSYSSVAQIGFVFLGVGLALDPGLAMGVRTVAAAAAIVYAANHAVLKATLFLAIGALERATHATRYDALGGAVERVPRASYAFLACGLALVGVPPANGFLGKLVVLDALVQGRAWLLVAVAVVGAVLTLAYVGRAWSRAFWGELGPAVESAGRAPPAAVAVALTLAAVAVVAGVGFGLWLGPVEGAARAALDGTAYADAVLGGGGP